MKNWFKNLRGHWSCRRTGCPTGSAEAHQVSLLGRLQSAHDVAWQVVLGAGNPENLTTGQVGQVRKVHVSLVEDDDFTRLNTGAKFAGAPVGVRERVLVRRNRSARCRQRHRVQTQGIAHVVESRTVGQLGVEQADDMTPGTEGAGVISHTGLASQERHQMRRNEVAKLAQQRKLADCWLVSCLFFHALSSGKAQTRKPTVFYPQPCGTAVVAN